ncbi:hypothetical protein [Leadbetterella byssophila]|uniref:Uncharacterized protein n=1 Tax=Leadbetterella byssophila (strain DSM 17132 / JCM 16389 / KACC 11308 / NBRC 106382 / 4M15) TaxID=649349 RepID=E4RVZ6_LEAB4|nr:hypothetical protein [Leadbetterella byssophila]ADQ18906.1 hypothetical protein Lbys_3245 [Leadbetterella byssophila DSM 17132]
MSKSIGKILLVFVMLLCLMKNSLLYTLYSVNQEVFVELFCINKDRPELHCDGKCELSKILKEKEKEKTSQVLLQLQLDHVFLNQQVSFTFPAPILPEKEIKLCPYTQDLYCYTLFLNLSEPPEFV